MKRSLPLLLIALLGIALAGCGVRKSQAYYDYESKVIASHADGSYTIRAWDRSRNATRSYEAAQKRALEDVLFRGVHAATSGLEDLKPLVLEVNARERYEDYFNAFFSDEKNWKPFVSMEDRRNFSSNYQRTDAQIQGQVTVLVFRSELKKKLQNDGILK